MAKLASKIFSALSDEFRALSWKAMRKLSDTVTVRTGQGLFTVYSNDAVGKAIYMHRGFEEEMVLGAVDAMRKAGKLPAVGRGTILDIGSNIGMISIGMLNKKFFDKAIAIEPDPGNFELLTRNVKQNGLQDSVLCVASAVSDRKGTVSFELSNGNFGDHRVRMHGRVCAGDLNDESSRKVIDVVSESLDGILDSVPAKYSDDIALIWIDVQGHEGYVFLGGKNIFSKDISVVTEIWPYGIQRSGMTRDQFCGIVQNIWSGYWVMRRGRFVRYPISMIGTFFDELNAGSSFDNCIFTK